MSKLQPKSRWRWWSTKTYPGGFLLPMDATRLYFCDGEAHISMDVMPQFARDAMFPEMIVNRMIKNLIEFKERKQCLTVS